jgi:hypothetical protein
MQNSEKLERLTIFNRLLASFPSTQSGQGDDALDGYLIGTREIPVDFLAIAAQRFLSGSVPGQHMTFPPTAAQFATEARDHWYKALEAEREKQARLAPPKPKEPEISPEERARVKAKFDALVASMAHEKMTDQAASARLSKERAERETKWLRDRGDLIETPGYSYPVSRTLAKQLGIGDPEGDADVA